MKKPNPNCATCEGRGYYILTTEGHEGYVRMSNEQCPCTKPKRREPKPLPVRTEIQVSPGEVGFRAFAAYVYIDQKCVHYVEGGTEAEARRKAKRWLDKLIEHFAEGGR